MSTDIDPQPLEDPRERPFPPLPGLPSDERLEVDLYRLRFARREIWATFVIIFLNAAALVLFWRWRAPGPKGDLLTLYRMGGLVSLRNGPLEWERLFAAFFLHSNPVAIAVNMFSVYALGSVLEKIYGAARFTVLYLICGLFGSLTAAALMNPKYILSGAAGAMWGLMSATVVIGHRPGALLPRLIARDISRRLKWWLLFNLAICFLPGVPLAANVGGGITGALFALLGALTAGFKSKRTNVTLNHSLSPGARPIPVTASAPDREDHASLFWGAAAFLLSACALSAVAMLWLRHAPWLARS